MAFRLYFNRFGHVLNVKSEGKRVDFFRTLSSFENGDQITNLNNKNKGQKKMNKISIQKQRISSMDESNKDKPKKIHEDGFIVRDGEKRVGWAKTRSEAEKIAKNHLESGTPFSTMSFTIEDSKKRILNEETGEKIVKKGFLVRSTNSEVIRFFSSKKGALDFVEGVKNGKSVLDSDKQAEKTEKKEEKTEKKESKKAEKEAKKTEKKAKKAKK